MNVHIRKRESVKSDKVTLALEIYTGYTINENGKTKANRVTKKLDYFYYKNASTTQKKLHNKEVERKVEAIRGETLRDLINGKNGFVSETKIKANFIEYFRKLTTARFESSGNYGNWDSVLKHLIKYKGNSISFENINTSFCEGFKDYLIKTAKTSTGNHLSSSSASSYFCKLRASLNCAVGDGIIQVNPALKVPIPKVTESQRVYLTIDEVKALYTSECRYDVLKRAFLFSCLTGLRWSDIQLLKWSQLQKEGNDWKLVFNQKKTKGLQYHYINEQAKELLGEKTKGEETIFVGLRYSTYINTALEKWVMRAGITKDITFHSARHTYATLLLTFGTDLYTVSKLLGHSHIKTTQIYAKVIDQKKIEATNNIPSIKITNIKIN